MSTGWMFTFGGMTFVDVSEKKFVDIFAGEAASEVLGVGSGSDVGGGGRFGGRPLAGLSASTDPGSRYAGLMSCNLLISDLIEPSLKWPTLIFI